MRLNEYLVHHPVFRINELDNFLRQRGSKNLGTRNSLLQYYRSKGRIVLIRRGLYAVVTEVSDSIDPYIVAGKIAEDAVLAYHTALSFHGKSYSLWNVFSYLSSKRYSPLQFQAYEFRCAAIPKSLGKNANFNVDIVDRGNISIRVTNLERTLVDVLDRPELAGSWEEIWRSLESIEYFDLEKIIKYVNLLKNATTAAKVGFYLEQHRETLMVNDKHIKQLQKFRPCQPHYLERSKRKTGRLISNWNLVVPQEIIHRSWAEVI